MEPFNSSTGRLAALLRSTTAVQSHLRFGDQAIKMRIIAFMVLLVVVTDRAVAQYDPPNPIDVRPRRGATRKT